ncbi:MAG: DUF4012 domain-containing protein [Propionibacteriaceae bacterium]|nr:DUF4012 domain-containing protein [Propionibacteriaceae bacterium]
MSVTEPEGEDGMTERDDAEHSGDAPAALEPPCRRRLMLRTLGPLLGVLVILLAWGGWQLWQLGSNLLALRDAAAQAQLDVQKGDLAALTGDLGRARDLAARADAAAQAPGVAIAARLPWVGDDVTVARELAGVAADLSDGTAGVDPLLGRLAGGAALDLLVTSNARDLIGQVRSAADGAAARLDRLDVSGLALPVGDDIARLKQGLAKVGPAVDALSPYLDALTILASPGTEHTWFVVLQNLGESRPSGGMVGTWLLVRTSDGKLEVLKQGFNDELDTERTPDYRGFLPDGYEQVFGDSIRNWRSFSLSAHFPDNARLFAHTWNARGEEKADGVLAFGQGSVRYLAAAAGPVEIDGRVIAPAQLADYLLAGVYLDYPDPVAKDAAVAEIMAQVLDRLSSGQFDLPGLLATALGGPTGDYLQLWSSDPKVQRQVEDAGLSGAFTDEPGPVASVRLADAAANKLDAFMHLGAEYRLGECVVDDGGVATRNSAFTVTLRNAVPDGLTDYVTGKGDLLDGLEHPVGSSRDFVVVHTPVQATVTSALVNGEPAFVQSAWVGERQLLVFDVKLDPGATATISLNWDEFPTDGEDRPFTLTPRIVLPPLANSAETRVVDGPPCG